MKTVAIIGAGVTGLTAAFYLKQRGAAVTLYEATDCAGGAMRSLSQDGYLAEFGPNTILETSPKITALVRDAGLQERRCDPDPKADARFVVRYGRPIEMPMSPMGFFTTKLFTASAKWAVLREPFRPARRDGAEESIADFVKRRLNQEILDHAIDALVAGIYAGDPQKLSVQQAFPKLAALEERYGSLIKGQVLGARDRKKRGEVAKDRAPKFSFDDGLQVLSDTLRERLGEAVQFNTTVLRLTQTVRGWLLDIRSGGQETRVEHSAVIYAGTAFKLAELGLASLQRISLAPFSEIRYPPVASVVLGFRREDVAHPCQGFGMLIPKIEGFKILGTIFSSSLFPKRAPAGHLTLTSYVGGERYPELASKPAAELCDITCADLRMLLGVKGNPTFQHSVYWPKAIPQYNLGYGRFRALMTEIEGKAPGLFFAGHYRDGISLGDCIVSGVNSVERVQRYLAAVTRSAPSLRSA
jgi:oxygen-dependent protoporphyrinogen oxidase